VDVPRLGYAVLQGFFENAAVGRNNSLTLQVAKVKEPHAQDEARQRENNLKTHMASNGSAHSYL
jgi:hypothetical protein